MAKFLINGGKPLSGEVAPIGNKNSILKLLPACLLTDEKVTLTNVPMIADVRQMIRLMRQLGAKIRYSAKGSKLEVDCSGVRSYKIDPEIARTFRGSTVLMGPLLMRFGKVETAMPGGCMIGPREMNAHFESFMSAGIRVEASGSKVLLAGKMAVDEIMLYEPSVTATENMILLAASTDRAVRIVNAACEPHTVDLCNFLEKLGAQVGNVESNVKTIKGAQRYKGTEHEVQPDHIDIGGLIIIAAITNGELVIEDGFKADMRPILFMLKKLGVEVKRDGDNMLVPKDQKMRVEDLSWSMTKGVYSQPWPCFPTDLMSQMVVLATQIKGDVLLFEKMFPGRMFFANYLNGLGARIVMCDPHRIVVNGPTPLKGGSLTAPDIRAGMAFVVAALAAEGESVISNVAHIDRGYPKLEERLSKLGADIKRVR